MLNIPPLGLVIAYRQEVDRHLHQEGGNQRRQTNFYLLGLPFRHIHWEIHRSAVLKFDQVMAALLLEARTNPIQLSSGAGINPNKLPKLSELMGALVLELRINPNQVPKLSEPVAALSLGASVSPSQIPKLSELMGALVLEARINPTQVSLGASINPSQVPKLSEPMAALSLGASINPSQIPKLSELLADVQTLANACPAVL